MAYLAHNLVAEAAQRTPDAEALLWRDERINYAAFAARTEAFAAGLGANGLERGSRVAVFLPKRVETVVALFGSLAGGGVMVPVNPVLKPEQVLHILQDSAATHLVTAPQRLEALAHRLTECPALRHVITLGEGATPPGLPPHVSEIDWESLTTGSGPVRPQCIDRDLAALFYTSGSTGRPKGVMISHANLVSGASSVAEYLSNGPDDRLLSVLPLSFDYGFSQLTTAALVGASVALMDYLLPGDVLRALSRYEISGMAAVPPLWNRLAELEWPEAAVRRLRYITNSGGALPAGTLKRLRARLPSTQVFLMYGLTEAFRSTYLHPDLIDDHPDSIGQAIPNNEVLVLRPDGTRCDDDEPGELVHRGSTVGLGYWNAPDLTRQRFRPAPGSDPDHPCPEIVVWSGDRVRRDAGGLLYFIGRDDDMIKCSGYRVSPTEVEEAVFELAGVAQAAALGIPHPELGQAIVLVVVCSDPGTDAAQINAHCRARLPSFMQPLHVTVETQLPLGPNGKVDRKSLAARFVDLFDAPDEDT
jgi:acyl-CoA ligase (AMP-forming) (exosortase A-associated)